MKLPFLLLFLVSLSPLLRAQDSLAFVRLDQEGFYPNAPKLAVVTGSMGKSSTFPQNIRSFYLIREDNGDTVFRGKLSVTRQSLNSSLQARIADFSSLTRT